MVKSSLAFLIVQILLCGHGMIEGILWRTNCIGSGRWRFPEAENEFRLFCYLAKLLGRANWLVAQFVIIVLSSYIATALWRCVLCAGYPELYWYYCMRLRKLHYLPLSEIWSVLEYGGEVLLAVLFATCTFCNALSGKVLRHRCVCL